MNHWAEEKMKCRLEMMARKSKNIIIRREERVSSRGGKAGKPAPFRLGSLKAA
jgi:hypothetical protein